MDNICGAPIALTIAPLIWIATGLILIFKKDWAWLWVNKVLNNVNPQRTDRWERGSTINGLFLLVTGTGLLIYLLIKFW